MNISRIFKRTLAIAGCFVASGLQVAQAAEIVVTHYTSLLYGAPYAIALEKGYFKEEGVTVDGILSSKGGGTSIRNLMAGETLFAEVALPAAFAAIKEGFPIKIISGGTEGNSGYYISRATDKLDKPQDLKGKRFAFSRPKSLSEALTTSALKTVGLSASDVKLIAIGDFGAGLTALENNQVDVTVLVEPIYSTKVKEGAKYNKLNWLLDKLPSYTGTVGVATVENIEKHGNELRALLKARRRAVDFIYAHPDEAAKIVAKAYNMSPDVMASAFKGTLELSAKWWNPGGLDYAGINNMAGALGSVDMMKLPVDWKATVDDRFVPVDLKKPMPN